MRNVIVGTAIATTFLAGVLLGHGEAMAASARLDAVTNQTNVVHDVSFYFRRSPHTYGPYYDYAYRPFWKYRMPSVHYRCSCCCR
jgi:hypothetical protein